MIGAIDEAKQPMTSKQEVARAPIAHAA
jgi:hypothetical protein